MKPEFSNQAPIYVQIINDIKMRIIAGDMKPGDKVAPVRDMAAEFGVNPNTMQRALPELEREGLVYTQRTAGRFITLDGGLIMGLRDVLADNEIERFIQYMQKIGYSKAEIIKKIESCAKEEVPHG